MKNGILSRSGLLSFGLGSLLMACSGAPNDGVGDEGQHGAAAAAAAEDTAGTPTPVATLTLENGNTLKFYDFGDRALIMEAGKAGAPQLVVNSNTDDIIGTWDHFAKGASVPTALRELSDRLIAAAPDGAMSAEVTTEPVSLEKPVSTAPTSVEKTPVGCNNGCCDRDYLEGALGCGDPMGAGYNWYLPGINSCTYNPKVTFYYGVVCAAVGTTTFKVNVGGKGGTWPVYEANWASYRWVASYNFFTGYHRETVFTTTTGADGSTSHAYCGRIIG